MRLFILFLLFPFIALALDISEYEKLVEVATAFVNNKAYEKAINSLDKAMQDALVSAEISLVPEVPL